MSTNERLKCITLPNNSVVIDGAAYDYIAGMAQENEQLKTELKVARDELHFHFGETPDTPQPRSNERVRPVMPLHLLEHGDHCLACYIERLEQCHREGWQHAQEVEDEYRKRTGYGFGKVHEPSKKMSTDEEALRKDFIAAMDSETGVGYALALRLLNDWERLIRARHRAAGETAAKPAAYILTVRSSGECREFATLPGWYPSPDEDVISKVPLYRVAEKASGIPSDPLAGPYCPDTARHCERMCLTICNRRAEKTSAHPEDCAECAGEGWRYNANMKPEPCPAADTLEQPHADPFAPSTATDSVSLDVSGKPFCHLCKTHHELVTEPCTSPAPRT